MEGSRGALELTSPAKVTYLFYLGRAISYIYAIIRMKQSDRIECTWWGLWGNIMWMYLTMTTIIGSMFTPDSRGTSLKHAGAIYRVQHWNIGTESFEHSSIGLWCELAFFPVSKIRWWCSFFGYYALQFCRCIWTIWLEESKVTALFCWWDISFRILLPG